MTVQFENEKKELEKSIAVKREKKKESMTLRLKEKEQQMTSHLVQKQSQQMLDLLAKKKEELKRDLERELEAQVKETKTSFGNAQGAAKAMYIRYICAHNKTFRKLISYKLVLN